MNLRELSFRFGSVIFIAASGLAMWYLTGGEDEYVEPESTCAQPEDEIEPLPNDQEEWAHHQDYHQGLSNAEMDYLENDMMSEKEYAAVNSLNEIASDFKAQSDELKKAIAVASMTLSMSPHAQPEWAKELVRSTHDLKADIKSLKEVLQQVDAAGETGSSRSVDGLSTTGTSGVDDRVSQDKSRASPVTTLNQSLPAKKIALCEAVLKMLNHAQENNPNPNSNEDYFRSVQLGCDTLHLYVKNIVEHQDMPRYRRVSRMNQSYKNLLVPLVHHDAVLLSVGFTRQGNYFEFVSSSLGNMQSTTTPTGLSNKLSQSSTPSSSSSSASTSVPSVSNDSFLSPPRSSLSSLGSSSSSSSSSLINPSPLPSTETSTPSSKQQLNDATLELLNECMSLLQAVRGESNMESAKAIVSERMKFFETELAEFATTIPTRSESDKETNGAQNDNIEKNDPPPQSDHKPIPDFSTILHNSRAGLLSPKKSPLSPLKPKATPPSSSVTSTSTSPINIPPISVDPKSPPPR